LASSESSLWPYFLRQGRISFKAGTCGKGAGTVPDPRPAYSVGAVTTMLSDRERPYKPLMSTARTIAAAGHRRTSAGVLRAALNASGAEPRKPGPPSAL
jgi:hypothetical protein